MLAAGATALFGGLGWMLAGHGVETLSTPAAQDPGGYEFLAKLGNWLTFAAAMTTTLLLSETSIDYLHFVVGGKPELWPVGIIVVSAAAVVLTSFGFVAYRTRAMRLADNAERTPMTLGALKIATVSVVALAITLARLPNDWLTAPNSAIVAVVLVLTLVLPAVVALAICYSAPSPYVRQTSTAISE